MTLKEAFESGKPFRRKSWNYLGWFTMDTKDKNMAVSEKGELMYNVVIEDAIANDWQVKEERTYFIVHIPGKSPEAFASEAYARNYASHKSNAEVIKVKEVAE